jgi:hypothetical protein
LIYIHAENLGLLDHLVNTNFAETSAKNYSWSIRLSTRDNSSDKDTTVVEMPQDMALPLFFWYMESGTSNYLSTHLHELINHVEMKDKILKQLEYSVATLTADRNEKVGGQVIISPDAYMAYEIEDHVEYEYENELYALLDAKGFEKEVGA